MEPLVCTYTRASGKHACTFTFPVASVKRHAYLSAPLPSAADATAVDDDEYRQRKKLKYSQGDERHENNVKEEGVSEDERRQRRDADGWGRGAMRAGPRPKEPWCEPLSFFKTNTVQMQCRSMLFCQ